MNTEQNTKSCECAPTCDCGARAVTCNCGENCQCGPACNCAAPAQSCGCGK
jgi:hypothetical protein